jgi:membrane-associated phospholipid phosphatase
MRAFVSAVALLLTCLPGPGAEAAAAPASQPAAPAVPPAATAPPFLRPHAGERLSVDWRIDVPVTGIVGLANVALALSESKLGPTKCRWCEPDLNAFDAAGRRVRWGSHRVVADRLGDAAAYGVTPAVTIGLLTRDALRAGGGRQVAADYLIILEAMAIEAAAVAGLKYSFMRRRPYVRDFAPGAATSGPDNLSFPSGHTSLAFCLATAAGTVSTLRGYRLAPWVWGTGMALATFTAYLRMAADRHYASDAIVGAAVGAAIGWAVPYIHYKLRKRR